MLFKSKSSFDLEVSKQAMNHAEYLMVQIGAEIHDDAIQKLSIVRLHIDNINRNIASPLQIQKTLVDLTSDFEQAINSIRAISHRLMPSQFEHEPLGVQVFELCKSIENSTKRSLHVTTQGIEQSITKSVKLNLFRICQELIQNGLKHSLAWNIWIRLKWTSTHILIEVEDDGTNISKLNQTVTTLELKNNSMRIRAKSLGAKITYTIGTKGLITRIKYTFSGEDNS
jgi:signal transduction histidine kinase